MAFPYGTNLKYVCVCVCSAVVCQAAPEQRRVASRFFTAKKTRTTRSQSGEGMQSLLYSFSEGMFDGRTEGKEKKKKKLAFILYADHLREQQRM